VVNYTKRQLDLTFSALAHPIRRGILGRLAAGEASVAELGRPYKVTAPAITKHMRILEGAGLVSRRREGRVHRCRLEDRRMREAEAWIEQLRSLWNERLDALARYLEENP
jgi:DNA-binding transcriptional ArsR family regulator